MYAIYHDLPILAAPKMVFDAVSQPEHLVNWWPQVCNGVPKEGEIYNFFFTEAYDWYGQVIKSVSEHSFHIKMTQSDQDWDPTSFGFDLQPEEKGVRLEFWHTGWLVCNHHYRRSSYCWAILLKGLKDYVEKGVIIPFQERE
ncbi:MAG: SRPBCC domain-containing protein [Saprospiraceae bacterium]|nr:SRPBCC domain-containing protein [Saprospiraceae bacterium]